MSKKRPYILVNKLSVGMLEELLKQVKNKRAVVHIADRNGLGVEPVMRGFVQASPKGRGVGVILCGDFDFNFDDEDDIDPEEDMEIPFDPDHMTPEKAALVYAFHDRVRKHLDDIDAEDVGICLLSEPSDCEDVEHTKGIEYL